MSEYTATVTQDEDLWVVRVSGLPEQVIGSMDYVCFSEIRDEVPEAVADLTDTDPEDFTLTWRYVFGEQDVTAEVEHYFAAEERFRAAQEERDNSRAELLAALAQARMTQRTMAAVVDLSPQRVHQLLRDPDGGAGPRGRQGRKRPAA